ncbi:hypothetical protein HK103_002484 [Boothiomyces macroporosus]|uniref:Arginine biosynthesis bifunctional protein ArgJ, mitochondrial n=1 Tax=Boothiomyces macroporosus TaxID=261099 RepID=A0AAD5Y4P6_9FUNG|nr:hypothetical protein HK103_002484 [Boothiomyces macroporosus]
MRKFASRAFPTAKQIYIPKEGTCPLGFIAGGAHSGVKKEFNDVAVVLSPKHECTAAAVFTKNKFCAAPVQVSKRILKESKGNGYYGVIVNSGCANACTGDAGLADAQVMAKHLTNKPVVVMSTGVIGQRLQLDKIKKGLDAAVANAGSDLAHWQSAAEGIMTTDTFPKLISREFKTKTGSYRMTGWSKGAGMIHPNMATMLSATFTDAKISSDLLSSTVKFAADRSFNAISIDGDTSTNDTYVVLANGASNTEIKANTLEYEEFKKNLTEFSIDLAKLIVRDGEGATKFIHIKVKGAKSFEEAKQVASTIATSPLVKTAIYGKDANWGRIVCAVGYSGVDITPEKVNLHFSSLTKPELSLHLFKNGSPFEINEDVAAKILDTPDILIEIGLGLGEEEASMFTCDFSHEYVSINADYRS